jgi:hypothetical protein
MGYFNFLPRNSDAGAAAFDSCQAELKAMTKAGINPNVCVGNYDKLLEQFLDSD